MFCNIVPTMLLLLIEAAKCYSQLVGFLLSEVVFSLRITGTSIGTLVTRTEGWEETRAEPSVPKSGRRGKNEKVCKRFATLSNQMLLSSFG